MDELYLCYCYESLHQAKTLLHGKEKANRRRLTKILLHGREKAKIGAVFVTCVVFNMPLCRQLSQCLLSVVYIRLDYKYIIVCAKHHALDYSILCK